MALVPSWVVSEFLLGRFKRTTFQAMGLKKGVAAKIHDPWSTSTNKGLKSKLTVRYIEGSNTYFPPSLIGAIWSYAIAGLVFASVIGVFNAVNDGYTPSLLASSILVTWLFMPGLTAIILIAGFSPRITFLLIVVYTLILFSLTAISTFHPDAINSFSDELIGWTATNIVPLFICLILLNRRIRGIAPLILTLGYILVFGINTLFGITELIDFSSNLSFIVLTFLTIFLVFTFSKKAVSAIANGYSRKAYSDQRLTINLVFLLFAAIYLVPKENQLFLWILQVTLAFLAYLILSRFLLRIWARPGSSPSNLLILRVFSLGSRSRTVFRNLSKLWRRVGTTNLLAGPDLLESTVEPNEFLLFLSGKWKKILSQVRARGFLALESNSDKPDPDGLYRVDEYFCGQENWKETMVDLAKKSDVVLMDTRGLTASNLGTLYELQQLLNYVELQRIVLLTEGGEQNTFLHTTLQQLWQRISPDSVNRSLVDPEILVFNPVRGIMNQIPELVRLLSAKSLSIPSTKVA